MDVVTQGSIIVTETDSAVLQFPSYTTINSCNSLETVDDMDLNTNNVISDSWYVTPQSSAVNVKEVFQLWDSESKGSRKRAVAYARELCANVLGGSWKSVPLEKFRIKAVTGGMSNLLFLVELPDSIRSMGKEPRKALMRILCGTDLERRLNESIIFTVLSERALGPKLLGVFPGGRFEQFIPSRPLTTKEISFPSVARRIGQLLARIHALDVPVAKSPLTVAVTEDYLRKIRKLNRRMVHKMKESTVEADDSCPKEITCDLLAQELEIVRQCLQKSDSPVVFSHNDLQELNILLLNKYTMDQNGNLDAKDDENPFALIDFEYSGYNYRGFDFANHLCEYMIDYSNEKPPYYTISRQYFPTEAHQRIIMNSYLDEMEKVQQSEQNCSSLNQNNDGTYRILHREMQMKALLSEVRRFLAVTHLFWSIWSFALAEESPIEFNYVSYGIDRLALYFMHKQDLMEYLQD